MISKLYNIISLFVATAAYIFVAPMIGYFKSFVAKKVGDDLAEQLGFLTLNPIIHIPSYWFMVFGLLIFGIYSNFSSGTLMTIAVFAIGIYGRVPINTAAIDKKYKKYKVFCAYFSDTFILFVIPIVSTIILFYIFKSNPSLVIANICNILSLDSLSKLLVSSSSLKIISIFFLDCIIYITALNACASIIFNACSFFLYLFFEHYPEYKDHSVEIIIISTIVLFVLFLNYLYIFTIYFIMQIAALFATLLGIL